MIRPLTPSDVDAFLALRRAALEGAPYAFLSSAADDRFRTPEAAASLLRGETGSVTFGAFRPEIVGMAGLFREPRSKTRHKIHVWGMYVDPAHRGQGLGGALLEAAVAHARTLDGVSAVHLGVLSEAHAARRVYERAGFEVWGVERDAVRHEGKGLDEFHMVLPLG